MGQKREYAPDEIKAMSPKQAESTFNDDERELFIPISKKIDSKEKHDHDWHYDLGREMAEMWRKTVGDKIGAERRAPRAEAGSARGKKGGQKTYFAVGEHFVLRMAVAKGFKGDDVLMNALRVVEAWPDPAAYQAMVDLRGPGGHRLSWTHLVYLAAVADADERMQIALECLERGWNAKQLFARLQGSGGRGTGGGGRPPKTPADIADALTHIQSFATQTRNLVNKAWLGDAAKGFNLGTALKKAGSAYVTRALLKDMGTTATQLASAIEDLQRVQVQLAGLREQAEAKIASREPTTSVREEQTVG